MKRCIYDRKNLGLFFLFFGHNCDVTYCEWKSKISYENNRHSLTILPVKIVVNKVIFLKLIFTTVHFSRDSHKYKSLWGVKGKNWDSSI